MEVNYRQHIIRINQTEDANSPNEWGNTEAFLVYDHKDFYVSRKDFDPRDIWKNPNYYTDYYIFPVYAYIHSRVALSLGTDTYPFTDRWDVSSSGYILVNKLNFSQKDSLVWATTLIEDWNNFLSGNVYGYEIYFQDILIDSSDGYYGPREVALNEAKEQIDFFIKSNPEKYAIQLKLKL